jgi:hypothetical protein
MYGPTEALMLVRGRRGSATLREHDEEPGAVFCRHAVTKASTASPVIELTIPSSNRSAIPGCGAERLAMATGFAMNADSDLHLGLSS